MSSIKIYSNTNEINAAQELLCDFGVDKLNPEAIKGLDEIELKTILGVTRNFLSKIAENKMKVSDRSLK